MANQVTKIPAWPFLIIANAWSYWPDDPQLVTLFNWDSFDKNLKQNGAHRENKMITSQMGGKI